MKYKPIMKKEGDRAAGPGAADIVTTNTAFPAALFGSFPYCKIKKERL